MTKEVFAKLVELNSKIKWCKKVIDSKEKRMAFDIDGDVIEVPDWLKNNIIKMAEKYKDKLTSEFEGM